MDPDVGYRLDILLRNREFPTLPPRFDALKSEFEFLGGRKDVLGVQNAIWVSIIIILNHNPIIA